MADTAPTYTPAPVEVHAALLNRIVNYEAPKLGDDPDRGNEDNRPVLRLWTGDISGDTDTDAAKANNLFRPKSAEDGFDLGYVSTSPDGPSDGKKTRAIYRETDLAKRPKATELGYWVLAVIRDTERRLTALGGTRATVRGAVIFDVQISRKSIEAQFGSSAGGGDAAGTATIDYTEAFLIASNIARLYEQSRIRVWRIEEGMRRIVGRVILLGPTIQEIGFGEGGASFYTVRVAAPYTYDQTKEV